MERRALELIAKIDEMGGMLKAVENGFPQREIAESALRWQREVESEDRLVVGVNAFQSAEGARIPTLVVHEEVQAAQIERLRQVKAQRDATAVAAALAGVERAAREGSNVMLPVITAVKAYATLGEISDVCRKVFGVYRDDGRF
jgi:methylmalonyl-CoA mutase N-terminal domain/subunit